MTTKEFIQHANEHPEICEKLSVCTAPEEAYDVACKEGLTDSMEDFVSEMTKLKEAVQLTDEDLEQISAGSTSEAIASTAITASALSLVIWATNAAASAAA